MLDCTASTHSRHLHFYSVHDQCLNARPGKVLCLDVLGFLKVILHTSVSQSLDVLLYM